MKLSREVMETRQTLLRLAFTSKFKSCMAMWFVIFIPVCGVIAAIVIDSQTKGTSDGFSLGLKFLMAVSCITGVSLLAVVRSIRNRGIRLRAKANALDEIMHMLAKDDGEKLFMKKLKELEHACRSVHFDEGELMNMSILSPSRSVPEARYHAYAWAARKME